MHRDTRRKGLHILVYIFAITGFASVAYNGLSTLFTGKVIPTVSAQTDPFLDRRIGQIEQRFYAIESRISRLEQDSRIQQSITPQLPNTGSNSDTYLLRSQIDTLQLRVAELECAAAKLDERTLPKSARDTRRQTPGEAVDICRKDANEPLKLSARP